MSCDFFPVPTAAPENLMVVNISANELNVSWERPNEININGILRYYIIDYYIVNQEENMASANVSGETLYTVLSGLNNFTTYSVSVAAFTVGTGPSSIELETTSENGEYTLFAGYCNLVKEWYLTCLPSRRLV